MKEIYNYNCFLNIQPLKYKTFKIYKYNLKSYYILKSLCLYFPFYKKNIKKNKTKFYTDYILKNENI